MKELLLLERMLVPVIVVDRGSRKTQRAGKLYEEETPQDEQVETNRSSQIIQAKLLLFAIMCQKPTANNRQKKGDSQQQQDGSCTEASCAQGDIDPSRPQYIETFQVPASQGPMTQDYDHRSMITVQSQNQSPQDIWFVSPTQRVLYQPMQWWDTAPEGPPPGATPADNAAEPKTNGNTTKGSPT
ncbi:uncharacterized protein FIESC28_06548 [Fusarium coffeatum]|uniref:Uncharacterized protein n=1 Tax=Fusarium coffeatum TaxID=231269 RepID=A0A366RJD2_9HYPO|nr:uncharacterized protein FIESC28_06548 [Fusarium coffeatum]RBR17243.1 hypothetical protein FIESC28_06548 [Fusarium coffeatum]